MKTDKEIREKMRCRHSNKYGLDFLPSQTCGSIEERSFYKKWCGIKYRCNNKKAINYERYGGRGIKVCERWNIFAYFFIDMWDSYLLHTKIYGTRNTTLDRIDNSRGYSKLNCRWATPKEQCYNKRNNIVIEGKTLNEWSKELGITRRMIYDRIYRNKLPLEKVLSKGRLRPPVDKTLLVNK